MTDIIKAFLTGGLICSLVQILLDRTKLMPGRVMVMLVVSGGILGWLGLYEPFAEWAGAGASVPLLGFGNTLWKGVAESMAEDGFLGIFRGGRLQPLQGSPALWYLDIWELLFLNPK